MWRAIVFVVLVTIAVLSLQWLDTRQWAGIDLALRGGPVPVQAAGVKVVTPGDDGDGRRPLFAPRAATGRGSAATPGGLAALRDRTGSGGGIDAYDPSRAWSGGRGARFVGLPR